MFEHVAIAHQYCIILCSLPSSIHTEPILCECYQQSPSIPVRLAGAGGGADPKRTEVKDGFFRVKDCFSPTCLYNSGKSTGVLYGPKSMGYFGVPSGSLRGPFGVPSGSPCLSTKKSRYPATNPMLAPTLFMSEAVVRSQTGFGRIDLRPSVRCPNASLQHIEKNESPMPCGNLVFHDPLNGK